MLTKYIINSLEDLKSLACTFGKSLTTQDVVSLSGDLGAGKTTFVGYLISSMLGQDIRVKSPSFNILCMYEVGSKIIYHYDLYRLKAFEEVYELAFEDALDKGVTIIEWPEIISHILPKNTIKITFQILENGVRELEIEKSQIV